MKTNTVGSWNLAEILSLGFGPEPMDEHIPGKPVGEGEVERGVIESVVARRLFTLSNLVSTHAIQQGNEHRKLHECPTTTLSAHDCQACWDDMEVLASRCKIIKKLFWRAVTEEHPVTGQYNVGLRAGWKLVSVNGEMWTKEVPAPRADSLLDTLAVRISDAFNIQGTDEIVCSTQVQVAEGEKVVATISDRRLQALYKLDDDLHEEAKKLLPAEVRDIDEAKFTEWFTSQRISDVKTLMGNMSAYREAEALVMSIFWSCVSDVIEGGHQKSNLALRAGWQVAEVPQEPSDIIGMGIIKLPVGVTPSDLGLVGAEIELPPALVEALKAQMGKK